MVLRNYSTMLSGHLVALLGRLSGQIYTVRTFGCTVRTALRADIHCQDIWLDLGQLSGQI